MHTNSIVTYPDGRMSPLNSSLYVGLSVKRLAQMRCDGTGPKFVKVSGRIFYFKEDLDSWINKNGRAVSTAEYNIQNSSLNLEGGIAC